MTKNEKAGLALLLIGLSAPAHSVSMIVLRCIVCLFAYCGFVFSGDGRHG